MTFVQEYQLLEDRFHVFKSITYDKMMKMLTQFKTGIIYIGGAWCKNCQAIVALLNKTAKASKIRTVYNYDPHFINVFKEEVDLRDCGDLETKLKYYALVEKVGFKSDELVVDTLIPRMPVPMILGIKNGSCIGMVSGEYVLDQEGLHEEGSCEDQTEQFVSKLKELFKNVKEKNRGRM